MPVVASTDRRATSYERLRRVVKREAPGRAGQDNDIDGLRYNVGDLRHEAARLLTSGPTYMVRKREKPLLAGDFRNVIRQHQMKLGPGRHWKALLLGLLLGALAACGGSDPGPKQTPAPTLKPTATPTSGRAPAPTSTPQPTPTATPVAIRDIPATHQDLPAMVLTYADLEDQFAGLQLDTEGSGYRDNVAAAKGTVDPDDTAADLAAQGRIDGYDHEFTDSSALLANDAMSANPHLALFVVDMYDAPEAALAALQRSMDDLATFQGQDLEGVIITRFERSAIPELGSDAVTGLIDQRFVGFQLESRGTFVVWVRGSLLARVLVVTLGLGDLSRATDELARRMDSRIAGVLAGEISATPIVPTPTPPATVSATGAGALAQGFDIAAMPLRPEDLSADAETTAEGFLDSPAGIVVYQRAIRPVGQFMEVGASVLVEVTQTITLQASPLEAQAPIRILQAMDLAVFKEIVGRSLLQSQGGDGGEAALDNLTVGRIDASTIGDSSALFSMTLETVVTDFEFIMIFFSTGRISFQFVATGTSGEVVIDDMVSLAGKIAERVKANSP